MNLVTYFDSNYIPKAAAMIRSLLRNNPDASIYALCCDEGAVNFAKDEEVNVIPLRKLEAHYPELRKIQETRGWVEFMWTLTPLVMSYLMEIDGLDQLSYVDADLFFFSPLDELYDEAEGGDICAIPHRWSPQHAKRLAPNGKYNVSWLNVVNSQVGIDFLTNWGDLCIDSCVRQTGNMGDQGYLDGLSMKYGIYDIQHLGANLAPWSQEQYTYAMDGNRMLVNGDRLLFYHFHEFLATDSGDTLRRTGYKLHPFVAEHIYPAYEDEIKSICRRTK